MSNQQKKFYYLDISGCPDEIKALFMGVTKIPLVDGAFNRDYDLLEDEIPADLCNYLRHEMPASPLHISFLSDDQAKALDFMPIGSDMVNWPYGAVLLPR